jgi:hypothetical protein
LAVAVSSSGRALNPQRCPAAPSAPVSLAAALGSRSGDTGAYAGLGSRVSQFSGQFYSYVCRLLARVPAVAAQPRAMLAAPLALAGPTGRVEPTPSRSARPDRLHRRRSGSARCTDRSSPGHRESRHRRQTRAQSDCGAFDRRWGADRDVFLIPPGTDADLDGLATDPCPDELALQGASPPGSRPHSPTAMDRSPARQSASAPGGMVDRSGLMRSDAGAAARTADPG